MRIERYFRTDLYRLWYSGKLFLGIVLVYIAVMANSFLWGRSVDVLLLHFGIRTFSTYQLTYIGCAVAFAPVLSEDMEHRFIYLQAGRGTVRRYTLSKVLVCFVSSVICMVSGTLLFVLTYRFRYPFCDFTTPVYEFYITQDVFRNILAEGHPVLYFAASSALTGMLAGLLSLFAMYLSLFIKNRLFVVCVPMIAHYFVDNYIVNWLKLPDWLSISYTFTSEIKMWQNSYISVLYACGMAGLGIGLFTVLITKKIRKGL
jgi:hypothetical protein